MLVLHICEDLFVALSSIPLVYVSVFMTVPYCFAYYSFVVFFEIRKCDAFSFCCSFSRLLWLFWGLSWSCTNFRIVYSILLKNASGIFSYYYYYFFFCHWNFDGDCMKSIDDFGCYGHFNNISSKP